MQLTGETIALNETATGTSNLIINISNPGESASFTNLSAGTFDSMPGFDTITINGLSGSETITAPNLASSINGKEGNDILIGGSAVDTISGGLGADTLTGNAGNDIFVIADGDSGLSSSTADIITDFSTGADKLKLGSTGNGTNTTGNYVEAGTSVANFVSALAAANTALNTLNTGTGSSPAYNTNADLFSFQYDSTYGYLFKDTDSDGDADMVIMLTGIDNTEIAHGDIIA